jgi:hypothetical protein
MFASFSEAKTLQTVVRENSLLVRTLAGPTVLIEVGVVLFKKSKFQINCEDCDNPVRELMSDDGLRMKILEKEGSPSSAKIKDSFPGIA